MEPARYGLRATVSCCNDKLCGRNCLAASNLGLVANFEALW